MASLIQRPEAPASFAPPRVRLQPVRFHHTLLDGGWWPSSTDLGAELRVLVPVLDHVRGQVKRLLLSPASWTPRPHQIVAAGRTVSIGYLAGQAPSMMTVLCTDGGTFTMRVFLPTPGTGGPDDPHAEPDENAGEAEGGELGPLRPRAML
jgi:hypothetical protein